MLITSHTPNYSYTMVGTAGKGEGARFIDMYQTKSGKNLLKIFQTESFAK